MAGSGYKKSKHPEIFKKKAKRAFDSMSSGRAAWNKQIDTWQGTVKHTVNQVNTRRSMVDKCYAMAMAAASAYSSTVAAIIAWEEKLEKADVRPFPDEPTIRKAKAELAKLEKQADKARSDYNQAKSAFLTEFHNAIEHSGSIGAITPARLSWFE